MSDAPAFGELPQSDMLHIDRLCDRLEGNWRRGNQITVEELLDGIKEEIKPHAVQELIPVEIACRLQAEVPVSLSELMQRFPEVPTLILAQVLSDATAESANASKQKSGEPPLPRDWGPFQLKSVLGRGGMGTVYLAKPHGGGKNVAIKLLRADAASQTELQRRFVREMQTAIKLQHPNIVPAHQAEEHEGQFGLVMDLVDGANLEQIVALNGPLPVDSALDVFRQAAAGLQFAHEQGIVHRDIKPANLLRDEQGTVKILDMGLARFVAPDEHLSMLTRTGMMMGTASYMSPEQARDPREVDERSDWYSLGCTLFYLLTGRAPYQGANPIQLALAHSQEPIPSLRASRPDVPEVVDNLLSRLLAKNPADRPATLEEILAVLDGSAAAESPTTPAIADQFAALDVGPLPFEQRRKRQPRPFLWKPVIIAGVTVLVLLVGVVAFFPSASDDIDATEIEQQTNQTPDVTRPSAPQFPDRILAFNGFNSFASVSEVVPEAGEAYTVEVLTRPQTFQTSNVVSWLGPDWMAVFLTADGHWGLARRLGEQQQIFVSDQPALLDRWTVLSGVFGHSEMTFYVDGIQQSGSTSNYPLQETTGGLYLGGVDPVQVPNRYYSGEVRSVRISATARQISHDNVRSFASVDEKTLFLLSNGQVKHPSVELTSQNVEFLEIDTTALADP
ncbi:MAG: protein kinase [Planctomycetaceae bacterium]